MQLEVRTVDHEQGQHTTELSGLCVLRTPDSRINCSATSRSKTRNKPRITSTRLEAPCWSSKWKVSPKAFAHLMISWNRGTPKSSNFRWFSLINHPFWEILGYPHLWKPPFTVDRQRPIRQALMHIQNCAVFLPIAPTEILKIGATKLNTNPSLRPPERLVVVRDNVLWTDGTSSFCWTSVVQRCHSQNFSHNTIVFATLPEKYREHAQWKAYWYLYLDPSDPSVWHTYGGFLK